MPRKNLPPFVQRVTKGKRVRFRGWAMVSGKRRFGPTRDDALQAHRDAIEMRGTGAVPAWGGAFGDRAAQWLADIAVRVSADTVEFYQSKLDTIWRSIPKSIPVDRLTADVLRTFVADARKAGLGARTVQHCRRCLRVFSVWCVRRGILQDNAVDRVEWPKAVDTPPDVMTETELHGHLAAITDPWAAALALAMAYTGLRRAEFARLQPGDVAMKDRVLWVRGKSRSQSHPIPEDAVAAMDYLLRSAGEFVVPGVSERARRSKISETFRNWQRKLGDPRWHPHALRHSVATILIRKGVSPATVQRFLRHASGAMTQRYVHLVESDLRDATTRLRLVGGDEADAQHG